MSDRPIFIAPLNPDDQGWEPHEDQNVPEDVGTRILDTPEQTGIERAQDVEPILERAKYLARTDQAWSPSREMLHLADFSAVHVEAYCNAHKITFAEFMADPAHVRRMLADPNLKDFLIWENVTHKAYR